MHDTVSVIIPTYNYGRFLGAALESVLAQTYPAHEIIVVDDGSTDDTAEVAGRYAERGVRYVYKENSGVCETRNLGISLSSGSLIAFLDADDEWLPEKLELQVEHLRRFPQVGLVTGGEWEVDDTGARPPWLYRRRTSDAEMLYPQILIENVIGSPSLVVARRECLEKVGAFDEEWSHAEDWDLWIRIAREYPVAVLGAPLIGYRRHDASRSSASVWQRYVSNRAFHRRHIRGIRRPGLRMRLLLSAQSMNLFYSAAGLHDTNRNRGLSLALAAAAVALDPTRRTKLKCGLLTRIALGQATFRRLSKMARPGAGARSRFLAASGGSD